MDESVLAQALRESEELHRVGQMTLTSTLNEGTRIELRAPLRAAGV